MIRTISFLLMMTTVADASCGDVVMPPAQYDHPPAVKPIVFILPWYHVNHRCHQITGGLEPPQIFRLSNGISGGLPGFWPTEQYKACSLTLGTQGIIYMSADDPHPDCMLRHEYAHLNGWPSSHPGGHYE